MKNKMKNDQIISPLFCVHLHPSNDTKVRSFVIHSLQGNISTMFKVGGGFVFFGGRSGEGRRGGGYQS